MALSQTEQGLVARIGFDESLLEVVKVEVACTLQQLRARDEDGALEDKAALLVSVAEFAEEKAKQTLDIKHERLEELRRKLSEKINPLGYQVFLLLISAEPALIVLRTEDQFDALRTVQTNGDNYEVSNDNVVAKLQDWNTKYGINIVAVRHDSVGLEFQKAPDFAVAG